VSDSLARVEPGASFASRRNLLGVETNSVQVDRVLTMLESVRCLACNSEYAKPVGGGTAAANPGCPECGYLGWQPVKARPPHRSAEGPLQRRSA
jgi:hypothetical protein